MNAAVPSLFTNVRLVGAPPGTMTSVAVSSGMIDQVGDASPDGGLRVIDGSGCTLMPGLIDAHLHLLGIATYSFKDWILEDPTLHAARAVHDMQALVDAGFTTVRDAGSDVSLALKRAQAEGSLRGPRVWASGRWISVTGGIPDISDLPMCCIQGRGMSGVQADGPDACRHAVRSQVRAGADVIKVATTGGIDPAFLVAEATMAAVELETIIDTAHDLGRRVTAHNNVLPGQKPTGILRAVAAGVDAIDHGYYLEDRVLDVMAENSCFWIITCSYLKLVAERGRDAGLSTIYTDKAKSAWEAVFVLNPQGTKCRRSHRHRKRFAWNTNRSSWYKRDGTRSHARRRI